jgi:acetate kinase
MDTILVANAGSSSVKFQVFATDVSYPKCLIKGQVEAIGTRPRLKAHDCDGVLLVDTAFSNESIADVPAALRVAGTWLRERQKILPIAVGHRVVHGGPDYDGPVLIDDDVINRLEKYVPLAPLHQPNNLAPIRSIRRQFPQLPQVACFDTAFHRGHDPVADHYAIPEQFYTDGVRRYGFHGLSYEYVASRLPSVAPATAAGRVIVAHLGSGASMCALAGGKSVDTTLGFTALDGLPMGTRPGQLDPGVVLYLLDQRQMTAGQIQHFLYHDCGLKGLSGISNDVRELEQSADPRAAFALDYLIYRVALNAGQLAAALRGLDAFVFTAGIGEHAVAIRARIAERLAWLGLTLDPEANAAHGPLISRKRSRVAAYVIPTNEELMIARHTLSLLARPSARQTVSAKRSASV